MPDLRAETLGIAKDTNNKLDACEARLMEQIGLLNARCDSLKEEIREMKQVREEVTQMHADKAKESLLE